MRILFLTSRMPYPPVGGDRFRVFHVLRTAAEAGHSVHIVTFDTHARDPVEIGPLERIAASVDVVPLPRFVSVLRSLRALPGRFPLQAAYYRSRRMRDRVDAALKRIRPDVAVTHLFRMAPYALPHLGRGRTRWVIDLTDVISAGIERSMPYRRGLSRWIYRVEGPRIRDYESRVAPRFDECWVISETEARLLTALAPSARIRVVPNGMGPERFRVGVAREPARLLFLGFHEVFHNQDAVRFLVQEIFPRVRAAVPEATLEIAGKGSESLGAWARVPGVHVAGFVPDLEAALGRATVFVAPHRFAAGVQNKVLQALTSGTPVVTTPIVRSGLEPLPADVLRVAEDADGIAAHVTALLRDPRGATALGERGRAWARRRFTWDVSLEALEAVRRVAGPARSDGRPSAVSV
ncbi:MAG TPA: glycosyltransferase family 4 protein [Candidatus Eisenbacteria bacterium]